jgi:phosphopantetheinyl transferase (holo-ACP synthase)
MGSETLRQGGNAIVERALSQLNLNRNVRPILNFLLAQDSIVDACLLLDRCSTSQIGARVMQSLLSRSVSPEANVHIFHDSEGAPYLHPFRSEMQQQHCHISLTDEDSYAAGLAVLCDTAPKSFPHIRGVGIDLLRITNVQSIWEYPSSMRLRLLTERELHAIQTFPHYFQNIVLAFMLSAKESSIKSMADSYRVANAEQRWNRPPIDLRDFEITNVYNAVPSSRASPVLEICGVSSILLSFSFVKGMVCTAALSIDSSQP